MSSPSVASYLVAAAECPNCRTQQKVTGEGRTIYVIELCDKHGIPSGWILPSLVTIRIRTQTSIVAVVDDSEGCLDRGICPACRHAVFVPTKGSGLWKRCNNCAAEWPVA